MAPRKPLPKTPRAPKSGDEALRKAAAKIPKARISVDIDDDAPGGIDLRLSPYAIDASGDSALGSQDEDVWVKASGWTPLEFLTHTYRNGFQKMEHRITAAKAVLDYTHRKMPSRLELSGELAGQNIALDAIALSKLSDKEIDTLLAMLEKIK
jgi:hypothetical protein